MTGGLTPGPGYLHSTVRMIPALRFLHKRQADLDTEDDISATTEALLVEVPETGVTLGQILGLYCVTKAG